MMSLLKFFLPLTFEVSFFFFVPHREQQLSNLLQEKKFVKALGLAITLNQPFKVLTIVKSK